MDIILIGALLFVLQFLLSWGLIPLHNINSTDHYGHLNQIYLIKKNRNRFIYKRDNFLWNDVQISAQLLHWMLSFLPLDLINKRAKYMPILFSMASLASFMAFIYLIYPYSSALTAGLSFLELLLYGGLLFILMPYNYSIVNARNVGMSARGLGLFFGQVFSYMVVLYVLSGNIWIYAAAILVCFLILLSSKFMLQYILFAPPLLTILYGMPSLLFIPILGVALHLLVLPKHCIHYLKSQWTFKVFYYQFLAKSYLLIQRYSIWRDLVYDFWKLAFSVFKRTTDGKFVIMYVYTNSVVILLLGMPLTIWGLYNISQFQWYSYFASDQLMYILAVPILVCFLLFLLTTFRATRFLGEPERYAEITMPILALVAAFSVHDQPNVLHGIIGYCIVYNIFQIFIFRRIKSRQGPRIVVQQLDETIQQYFPIEAETRILSHEVLLTKLLMRFDRKIFFGSPVNAQVGPWHYTEVFTEKKFVNNNMIVPIIETYKINCLIIDTVHFPEHEEVLQRVQNFQTQLIKAVKHYKLYLIKHD